MLPVLWHHPIVCFDITHLHEKWLADLTQTWALPNARSAEKCVVVTVDPTGLGGAMPRGSAIWRGRLLLYQLWCSGLAANQQCARLSKKLLVLKSTNNIELNENQDIVSDIIDVTFSLCRSKRSRTIQAKQPTNPRAVIDPPVSLTGAM